MVAVKDLGVDRKGRRAFLERLLSVDKDLDAYIEYWVEFYFKEYFKGNKDRRDLTNEFILYYKFTEHCILESVFAREFNFNYLSAQEFRIKKFAPEIRLLESMDPEFEEDFIDLICGPYGVGVPPGIANAQMELLQSILSIRVWDNKEIDNILNTLDGVLQSGEGAIKASKRFLKYAAGKDKIMPKYLEPLEKAFKEYWVAVKKYAPTDVITANIGKELKAIKSYAKGLRAGQLGFGSGLRSWLNKFERDYKEVTNVKWFKDITQRKATYNARRLLRTEINSAYREAQRQAALQTDIIIGYKWNLSGSHPREDICDDLASREYYDKNEPIPDSHPNCLCYITDVVDWNIQREVNRLLGKNLGESKVKGRLENLFSNIFYVSNMSGIDDKGIDKISIKEQYKSLGNSIITSLDQNVIKKQGRILNILAKDWDIYEDAKVKTIQYMIDEIFEGHIEQKERVYGSVFGGVDKDRKKLAKYLLERGYGDAIKGIYVECQEYIKREFVSRDNFPLFKGLDLKIYLQGVYDNDGKDGFKLVVGALKQLANKKVSEVILPSNVLQVWDRSQDRVMDWVGVFDSGIVIYDEWLKTEDVFYVGGQRDLGIDYCLVVARPLVLNKETVNLNWLKSRLSLMGI